MSYSPTDKPTDFFNSVIYTGNGSSPRSITGVGFQPDLIWFKNRTSAGYFHELYDFIRGVRKPIYSNSTNAEGTTTASLESFDSDGFSVDSEDASGEGVNKNGDNYVAWNWLAANTTASNTDGSITSTVSANTTAGFSIVSYTGNATSGATVGHGLNQTPEFILTKNRIDGTSSWGGYHVGIDATAPEDYVIQLDGTGAKIDVSTAWNDTAPTSSVVTLGNAAYTNGSSQGIIMYCFHSVKGYSKFGSYTGNGSTDGTFIYTGFKPAMVIIKASSAVADWYILDNKRDPENVVEAALRPNLSNAESTTINDTDFLSNGFKTRSTSGSTNGSGTTYIYMAFAENPLVTTGKIPATAR